MLDKSLNDEYVLLGQINGHFGVNGWVKVFSYTEPKQSITGYKDVLVCIKGSWTPLQIMQGRLQGKAIVIKFDTFEDRESSERLMGCDIAIHSKNLPKLADDDYYWRDLIGLRVYNKKQIELGVITSMLPTAGHDVVVVNSKDKQQDSKKIEHLIPYVFEKYVLEIDLNAKTMMVDWEQDYLQ